MVSNVEVVRVLSVGVLVNNVEKVRAEVLGVLGVDV